MIPFMQKELTKDLISLHVNSIHRTLTGILRTLKKTTIK